MKAKKNGRKKSNFCWFCFSCIFCSRQQILSIHFKCTLRDKILNQLHRSYRIQFKKCDMCEKECKKNQLHFYFHILNSINQFSLHSFNLTDKRKFWAIHSFLLYNSITAVTTTIVWSFKEQIINVLKQYIHSFDFLNSKLFIITLRKFLLSSWPHHQKVLQRPA